MTPPPDELALWAAVRATPDDDLPRLVYADWLEEHGDDTRAEFIRVQYRLAALPTDRRRARAERSRLEGREAELLDRHADGWLAPVLGLLVRPAADATTDPADPALAELRLARGLSAFGVCSLGAAERLAAAGDDIGPVNAFEVFDGDQYALDSGSLDAVAAWPGAGCVAALGLTWASDRDLATVAASPHLRNLAALSVVGAGVTDAGAATLAASLYLAHLTAVVVYSTAVTGAGFQLLIDRFGHNVYWNGAV